MHRENENFNPGGDGANFSSRLQAIQYRHRNIQNDQIGLEFKYALNSFLAIAGWKPGWIRCRKTLG